MIGSRILSFLALGLTSSLAVAACSGDSSSGSDPVVADADADSGSDAGSMNATTFVDEYCSIMMPCCTKAGLNDNPSACQALLNAFAMGQSFDEAKGHQCLELMRAASSSAEFCSMKDNAIGDSAACDAVFSTGSDGSVQPGGQCVSDSDCASTSEGKGECFHYWDGDASFDVCMLVADGLLDSGPCIGTREGNVTMYTSSGQPPTLGYLCDLADGLYCDSQTTKCVGLRPIGTDCSNGAKCVEEAYCASSTGQCSAKLAVGSTCENPYDEECVDAAYCDDVSLKCTEKLADGASCSSSAQCLSGLCNNAKCELNPDLGLALICGD